MQRFHPPVSGPRSDDLARYSPERFGNFSYHTAVQIIANWKAKLPAKMTSRTMRWSIDGRWSMSMPMKKSMNSSYVVVA
jgi:hypothetical protein